MSASDLKPYELMQKAADFLESEAVPYRIVGSMASMAYGEPRFTNDIDILVDLPLSQTESLNHEFPPPEFYVSVEAVRDAINTRGQFNILHSPSGLKIDMILSKDSDFGRMDIAHGQRLKSEGFYNAMFASPENVLLKKLMFYQEGGSDKHLRDVSGILLLQGDEIDQEYLNLWAAKLSVTDELQLVLERLRKKSE